MNDQANDIPNPDLAMPAFKAALFDLDGTLLDTLEDLGDSMNAALAAMNLPDHPMEKYRYFVGDGVEELVRRCLPSDRRDDRALAAETARHFRLEYGNRWSHKTHPYDGVNETLIALARGGLRLAVFSNKPDDFTRAVVTKFFPDTPFAAVVGAKPGIAKKPDPAAAITIASQMGIKPADFLYVGDTNTDMKTAVAAGMYPAGALWGFRTADELLASGAKVLLAKPLDILELIK